MQDEYGAILREAKMVEKSKKASLFTDIKKRPA
jgi:hypothetical protein